MKKLFILITSAVILITSCKKGTKGDTGPAGANGSSVGYTHYIGEIYKGGVVFHLFKGTDGIEHGLIVALTQTTATSWQTTSTLVNANKLSDGAYNTALMINSPAANYVASLGVGWYVPAIDELSKLYYNRYDVDKTLETGGYTLINITTYVWSSTEISATFAYTFNSAFGYPTSQNKSNPYIVRAVKAF